jgi:predicted choloylglycine hydrolase
VATVKRDRRASYDPAIASNLVSMKSVIQDLTQEIEYLCALAEMYRQAPDAEAHQAALEAKAALERLRRVINESTNCPCSEFPAAA